MDSNSSSSSCSSSASTVSALDLYGKRRQLIKIQILEREIRLLQEELKYVDEVQPASRCCKELEDFVETKEDPMVTLNKETHKSTLCCKKLCFPWIWCFGGCCKLSKSCCNCSDTSKSSSKQCSKQMKKKGGKNCCYGVSCPIFVSCCCCFSSSFCKCQNLCRHCSIPCCCCG